MIVYYYISVLSDLECKLLTLTLDETAELQKAINEIRKKELGQEEERTKMAAGRLSGGTPSKRKVRRSRSRDVAG